MIFRSVCRVFVLVFVFATGGAGMAAAQTVLATASALTGSNWDSMNAGGVVILLQGFSSSGDGGGGLVSDLASQACMNFSGGCQ
jgi:hypothetical protein